MDEVRALKYRLLALELARLEDVREGAAQAASHGARRSPGLSDEARPAVPDGDRRYVDAERESSKAILTAKFEKFEATLSALARYLGDLAPLRALEARLAEEAERQKKAADELRIRREVASRQEEDAAREKDLLAAAEDALRRKELQLEARLADLDVVRRAKELAREREEFDGNLQAYEAHAREVAVEREKLNRDFENLGQRRAEIEREEERLTLARRALEDERGHLADGVARGMAGAFEATVRDILRSPGG